MTVVVVDVERCTNQMDLNKNRRLLACLAYLIRPVARLHGRLVESRAGLVEDRQQLVGIVREGLHENQTAH